MPHALPAPREAGKVRSMETSRRSAVSEEESGSEIRVEREAEGLVVVTLNRPRRRNSLTLALWQELGALYRGFADDASVRSVILTGAAGQFSAGADITEFPEVRATAEQARSEERRVGKGRRRRG